MRLPNERLDDNQRHQLINQFTSTLGKLNARQAHGFYFELFGYEEKEIFAKRLAAILLLHEKRSCYAVARLLKMSPSTIGILSERYERGEFAHILTVLAKKKKDYTAILTTIESILSVGGIMPPRNYVTNRKR